VVGVFDDPRAAAAAARAVHGLGVQADRLSIVASNHEEEGLLAREMDGTPGADIEDSRVAARLAEFGARVIAAVALVLPGIGPILAAGPLAAGLGEAAGHVAGGLAVVLRDAGVDEAVATSWESRVEQGAVLLGVHAVGVDPIKVQAALQQAGARETALATWPED
jgi:hypothetical protein